jgi:hypothetical protein
MEQLIGKTFSLHLNASTFLGFSIIHGLESAGGTQQFVCGVCQLWLVEN